MTRRLMRCGAASLALVAGLAVSSAQAQAPAPGARPAAAASAPTPRLSDGKPDLSGWWGGGGPGGFGGGGAPAEADADTFVVIPSRDGDLENFENDFYVWEKSHENIPIYKPEHWAKVRELDLNGNKEDPAFHCLPQGVPRMGPPNRIIATPDEVILFNNTVFRMIKIGKPRDANAALIESWNGYPEARWDGDTLVIESTGFNDSSWLGWGGYFHSYDLKVTETFRREGDTLHYTAVAEDPTVLQEPWKLDPVALRKGTNPNATIAEATPCSERDAEEIPNNIRG